MVELQNSALLETEEANVTAEESKLHEMLNGFAAVQRENAKALTESEVAEIDAQHRAQAAVEEELHRAYKQMQELETAQLQTVAVPDMKTEMEVERAAREKVEGQYTPALAYTAEL
ncbi:uncharacterized protein LAESUDRAFT_764866 [Laetiporus sulphureus 93-53]|uniref:Uncharacterized protein n=1 Tax=Laetiporus sulphureus 93-53 TaxID=1314785 RepID=A0A165B368_9APHY|nr:uncharacterized protein LAESUDRAFT_764866 [Laetiporus sulphureus 93-53]KZT00135.1 hypothetical protein LAESUDRAFT_764866 [Laetiporus sulphureus 93-53]